MVHSYIRFAEFLNVTSRLIKDTHFRQEDLEISLLLNAKHLVGQLNWTGWVTSVLLLTDLFNRISQFLLRVVTKRRQTVDSSVTKPNKLIVVQATNVLEQIFKADLCCHGYNTQKEAKVNKVNCKSNTVKVRKTQKFRNFFLSCDQSMRAIALQQWAMSYR
jgi:hypothetical protein